MSSPPSRQSGSARPLARRRGRRPAGQDTRGELLAAARAEFSARGYQGARVRSIAAAAGVDPAMVNHWFGGKDGLFIAALELPITPEMIAARVLGGDLAGIGERIVTHFLTAWDDTGGGAFAALLRSVASHEGAARMMREFLTEVVFGHLATAVSSDRVPLRAALCASQVVGLGMARYVIKLEPLASAEIPALAALIGPSLRRYLLDPLPTAPPGEFT